MIYNRTRAQNSRFTEAKLLFDLLHFGTGLQAVHYFVFCFTAITGVLQWVATRYNLRDLVWFKGNGGYLFGPAAIIAGGVWFFLTDEEIFIPGLAGGELFLVFVGAFLASISFTRVANSFLARVRTPILVAKNRREKEPLT
jgi:hypothetical protein